MKARTLLVTLVIAMAVTSMAQFQGGPPQGGGPGGRGGPGFGGPGGPGGMERGLPPIDRLVFRRDVQDDIQVTDAERTKLEALRETMRSPGGPGFGGPGGFGGPPPGGPGGPGDQGGPPQGGRGQGGPGGGQDARQEKNVEAIKAILTSDQFTRVKEIGIQLAGIHAILDKGIQTKLAMTVEQKDKLSALMQSQREAMRAQFENRRDGGNGDPQHMREAMDANRKAFDGKLKAILTSDQAAQLTAMGGKPFTSTEDDRPGGPPPPPPGEGGE